MRSTLIDIAREAGVSSATVDRVLNNRTGVKERTREVVMDAARRLGYVSAGSPAGFVDSRVRLDFVLPAGTNTFIANLLQQLESQAATRPDLDVRIHSIEGFNPDTLARTLHDLHGQTMGVGVIALDHPTVREAMRSLSAAGVPIVTLVSDILHVPRIGYIGIDNRAAGRLGGYLLGRFLGHGVKRKVALFAGSLSYRGHEEREMGFRHIIADEFPDLEVVELREIRDDRDRAFEEATALFRRHPDLAGIYNIGAGNSGIGRALVESGLAKDVIFVGHELTEHTKMLLLSGVMDAVIDQNPRVEAREALSMLSLTAKGRPIDYHPPRLQVIFRENIPET
ncbi:LacI family transcriptional regulator [Rhizobium subbaraonis]|uniref:LacI family transcriptional regulator n=1 Tax=Rhizobium subbaraonis TaxID=908946 RepID=A0A285U272_9HYPH|nr:LacI family DNA-binding transcriptional regulator [Rhizobium subbaraonis]SOC35932.1 LacI family transcriptional regulator [Rhizobium subbaraonis]